MANQAPKLEATPRERLGTRYARRLRKEGKLPAVLYGHGETPAHVAVDRHELHELLHDGAHMLELHHNGKPETCLIQDVQYDYMGDEIVHVDLVRRSMSEEVSVNIAIEITGQDECKALQESGAFLDQSLTDLEVICKANAIPDQLTVDITELEVHGSVSVGDVPMPTGVRTEHDPDDVVVAVHVAAAEPEEEEEAAEGEGGEPEVIGEGEKEEESGGE